MSQILCTKHNCIIQYVCTLQKCPQGHLICEKCKQLEAQHFAQHLNFIYLFKQFISFQNPKSFKELIPKLQKAVSDCQIEMNNQKNVCRIELNEINNEFKKLHDVFIQIQQKTQNVISQSFMSDYNKYELKLQTLKTQLKQLTNLKQKQTSFFGSLFSNEEIKVSNTIQLIEKILIKNNPIFKLRADLIYFDKQIKKYETTVPKYKTNEKAKSKFAEIFSNYQNFLKKNYLELNQLFYSSNFLKKSIIGQMRKNSTVSNQENNLYQSKISSTSQKSLKSLYSQKNQIPPSLPKTTYPTLHPNISTIIQSLDPMPINSLGLKQQGPYKYKEGIYIGNYNNKLRHGKGKFIFNDGSYYQGYWRNDIMFGVGRLITKTYFYQGQINQGRAQGNGRIEDNEKVYHGQWYNDMKHGQGRLQYKNRKLKYNGTFQNNLFHGNGILQTQQWRYQGSYWSGQKSGQGTIRYSSGETFIGKFRNDFKLYGKFIWSDGSYYQGTFQNDIPHGNGIFYWNDGTKYQGTWRKGVQDGVGRQIYNDKSERRGQWQNGQWKRWF